MILEEEESEYVYDLGHPVPQDADLSEIIPRKARWSETLVFFLSEDFKLIELAFGREKQDGHLVPGDDVYEVRKKLVKLSHPSV